MTHITTTPGADPTITVRAAIGSSGSSFHVSLRWNGALVCSASCTGVMAHDIVREHFAGNFAGAKFDAWLKWAFDSSELNRILTSGQGDGLPYNYSDATGSAAAWIECVQPMQKAAA